MLLGDGIMVFVLGCSAVNIYYIYIKYEEQSRLTQTNRKYNTTKWLLPFFISVNRSEVRGGPQRHMLRWVIG